MDTNKGLIQSIKHTLCNLIEIIMLIIKAILSQMIILIISVVAVAIYLCIDWLIHPYFGGVYLVCIFLFFALLANESFFEEWQFTVGLSFVIWLMVNFLYKVL